MTFYVKAKKRDGLKRLHSTVGYTKTLQEIWDKMTKDLGIVGRDSKCKQMSQEKQRLRTIMLNTLMLFCDSYFL